MKIHIFLAVVAALALYVSGAAVELAPISEVKVTDTVEVSGISERADSTATARNLNVGWITTGDRLLYRNYFYKAPIANAIQTQDITYLGNSTTWITAIQVNEVGYTQFATAIVTAGGINTNTISIRLSTARSYGYYFLLDIWGR